MSRITLFIALSIYLILAVFLMTGIGIYFNSQARYEQSVSGVSEISGYQVMSKATFIPIAWIATVLVGIPFVAWVIIGITLFFPTGNAGA